MYTAEGIFHILAYLIVASVIGWINIEFSRVFDGKSSYS